MALLRRHKDDPGSDVPHAGAAAVDRGRLWIEDDQGERAYKVNGKAMRLRHTFVMEDTSGGEVAHIQEKKLTVRDKIVIERDGHRSRRSTRRSWASGTASPSTSRMAPT